MSLSDCDAATSLRTKLRLQSAQTAQLAVDSANAARISRNRACDSLMRISDLTAWDSCVKSLARNEKKLAPIEDLQSLTGSSGYVDDLVISDNKSLTLLNESKRLHGEAEKLSTQMNTGNCPM
jgi:hypothetical protein